MGYKYYSGKSSDWTNFEKSKEGCVALSEERFNPNLRNPDYLVLTERRRIFSDWIKRLNSKSLNILDIGGRIQPYRKLLFSLIGTYIAIDPQFEGLIDIVAIAEELPFKNGTFDLILCNQVFSYVKEPGKAIEEMLRVLKPKAGLFFSVPALFPKHHDELWRFLPDGLAILFSKFSSIEIKPEGYSIVGISRTVNVCLDQFIKNRFLKKLVNLIIIPCINLLGKFLDRFSHGNDQFTANYCLFAKK